MNGIVAIALGGACGAVLRHYAGFLLSFPYGTLCVNVVGAFLIGLLTEALALRYHLPLEVNLFLVTGLLGGFTTFSTFSLDVFKLVGTGQAGFAAAYAALSVFGALAAVFGGVCLGRGVFAG